MTPDDARELAALRVSLDATRDALEDVVRGIDRRTKRRTNGLIVALVVVAGYVGINAWSRHVDEVATCRRGNETRELIREMTRDASIAAGEALVDVSGADDETVERYRAALDERLSAAVNRLSDREC